MTAEKSPETDTLPEINGLPPGIGVVGAKVAPSEVGLALVLVTGGVVAPSEVGERVVGIDVGVRVGARVGGGTVGARVVGAGVGGCCRQ